MPTRARSLSWATILSVLTAAITAGGVTLHLIGDVTHRQYLRFWGIESSIFPKSTDWILINGYYSLVDRFIVILGALWGNALWLLLGTVALGLYIFVLLSPIGGTREETPTWMKRWPKWGVRLLRQMWLTALFVAAIPCAMIFLTAMMVIPAALGETAGKAAAEKQALHYQEGCEKSKRSCVQIKRDGEIIATGFVLESSPLYIAILDEVSQQARVIPLDKVELIFSRADRKKLAQPPGQN